MAGALLVVVMMVQLRFGAVINSSMSDKRSHLQHGSEKNMENNIIEVTGISKPLLKLIDERVRLKGGDRAAYVRDLIERDIFGTLERQKYSTAFQKTKRSFDPEAWKADIKILAEAEEIPILPPEAFTRESIYGNHD